MGLGQGSLQELLSSSSQPYSTYTGQQNNMLSALQALQGGSVGSYALPQSLMNDYQSYLGLGQSASALGMQNQQQGFNQNMLTSQALGQGLGGLFGGSGGSSFLGSLFGGSQNMASPYSLEGYSPSLQNFSYMDPSQAGNFPISYEVGP